MTQPPILTVHDGGDPEEALRRRREAWGLIRDAYDDAVSVLCEGDPDRALMARQRRRAGLLAALPALAAQAPLPARREERPA